MGPGRECMQSSILSWPEKRKRRKTLGVFQEPGNCELGTVHASGC